MGKTAGGFGSSQPHSPQQREEENAAVTVIIPTWNRAGFIGRAIDSVLGQELDGRVELIVVDDGSTDTTSELLAGYGKRLRVLHTALQGPAAARNAGIRAAQAPFIAFLDSDDRFAKKKLSIQLAAMRAYPDLLISHTDEIWYRRGQLLNQKKKHARPGGDIFVQSLSLCVVGMSTVMVRRAFFDRVGLFDGEFPCCEDYELWLRAAVILPFLKIDQPLTLKEGGRDDQVSVRYRVGIDRFRIRALQKLLYHPMLSAGQRRLALDELARKCRIYGNGCRKHGKPQEARRYLALAETYR